MPLLNSAQPLVSCIMPTYNRRPFVPWAIEYWLRQDYPNKELIIVDDGEDAVRDLLPNDAGIRYIRLDHRHTVGAKRNIACEAARGEIIAHWDDDDWHAPHRLSYQVGELLSAGTEVCGIRQMLFYDPAKSQVWLYEYPAQRRLWLAGGSLVYQRDFWRRKPFPEVNVGEDARFIWGQETRRVVVLPRFDFYVALIHERNTSPKQCHGPYWSLWGGDLRSVMSEDLDRYVTDQRSVAIMQDNETGVDELPSTYAILMVAHNARDMVQMSTLRTLKHIAEQDARLIVVDNGSSDGATEWLAMLAERGDIRLIRNATNVGHGPALEQARRQTRSQYLVTLDSDAFPLSDDWLTRLRERLVDPVKVAGILHHRDYIHPSCLMIARKTLDDFAITFLNEKDKRSQLDVAERISVEVKRRGYCIDGLERTGAHRRGSTAEPIYLGSVYEGLVHHQWYTTRAATAAGHPVDDVPTDAIEQSLHTMFDAFHTEERDITVVIGVRAASYEPQRLRNAKACLHALNMQSLARWRYRLVAVEQDSEPRLRSMLESLVDRYIFAFNPGPYNRGWAFNIGAVHSTNATSIMCMIDADLLVPPDFLERCLQKMLAGAQAVQPYTDVIYLDEMSSERAIRDHIAAPKHPLRADAYNGHLFTTSQGGCICVDAALYRQIGGHDERFRGWGYEDRDFWSRLASITQIVQLPEKLLHLNHPRPATQDESALANRLLATQPISLPTPRDTNVIGDVNRYSAERVSTMSRQSKTGRRAWENWHRWDGQRIEQIVRDEQRRPQVLSARRCLAHIVASLGDRLLDLGCGPGAMWSHLELFRPRLVWTGVDATPKMLAAARRLFPGVPVIHADAAHTPFDDKSFDVVLLRHVLEHLPHELMDAVVTEALRLAQKAVVVDFFVPPIRQGARQTKQVGEGFLETQWTSEDFEAPVDRAKWQVSERLNIVADAAESNEVWVLKPPAKKFTSHDEQTSSLKISIIMPTFRRQHTILRTIASIQAQTHGNWELIIVDNAGDGGYEFSDPRIRVFRRLEHASASYARNEGVTFATGDLVCFFDDDDDMFPNYLERFVATFERYPRANLVRCGMDTLGQSNFSLATPECCLRRSFATATWRNDGPAQDQRYFSQIISSNGWTEAKGDIVVLPEVLCRANADPAGGLRAGRY